MKLCLVILQFDEKKNHKNAQAQNDFTVGLSWVTKKNTETEDLKYYLLWVNTKLRRYDFKIQNVFYFFFYVRLQIIRRTRSDKTASEELLTGEDPAKNHTTGVENRREYSTPHSAALRQTASDRRQASLYQRCSGCTRDL